MMSRLIEMVVVMVGKFLQGLHLFCDNFQGHFT